MPVRYKFTILNFEKFKLKSYNAGSYRIMKYGDTDSRKGKYLTVIITADVRVKKIIGIEWHMGEWTVRTRNHSLTHKECNNA